MLIQTSGEATNDLDLYLVVCAALLTWVMLITASVLRTRSWTAAGMRRAVGNRDDVPEPSPIAARADRAARNMVENLTLFVALVLAVHAGGVHTDRVDLGAKVFLLARVFYFPVYLAGIRYLRTGIWLVSLVGLRMIVTAAL